MTRIIILQSKVTAGQASVVHFVSIVTLRTVNGNKNFFSNVTIIMLILDTVQASYVDQSVDSDAIVRTTCE